MSSPHPPVGKRKSRDAIAISHGHSDGRALSPGIREYCSPVQLACSSKIAHHFTILLVRQSRYASSLPGMGTRERERYHRMSNAKQTRRVTPASSETLLHILETLPGALLVVDDTE